MTDPKRQQNNIRVLILEDNPADAELVEYELREAGFTFTPERVADRKSYIKALREFRPDIILSDYDLPSFTGADALQIKRELCPHIPFILVTGAVGEERAIEMLTGGATDYVLKKNLSRLRPAFNRALREADEHERRKQAERERDNLLRNLERRVRERTEALQGEINERKRIEQVLQKTADEYRYIVENAPTAIYELDYIGPRFKRVNNAMCLYLGYTREEMMNMNPFDILDEESQSRFRERIRKILSGEWIDPSVAFAVVTRDGRKIWALLNVQITYENGRPTGALVIAHDITERRRAEQELSESETKYRNMVLNSPDSVIVHRGGNILFANPAALELLGAQSEDQLKSRRLQDLTPPSEARIASERSRRAYAGENQPPRDGHMLRLDGRIIEIELTSSSIYFEGQRAIQVLLRNVSERKKAEQAFIKWSAELEKANKELDALNLSISHDLETPLRTAADIIKFVLKEHGPALDAELHRKLGVIESNLKIMSGTVNALLELSRADRKGLSPSKANIKRIVEFIFKELKASNPHRKIEFKTGRIYPAYGDAILIRKVFLNLLENAVKFTSKREYAVIEVGSYFHEGEAVFSVRDNGIGFDMKNYEKLFALQGRHADSDMDIEGTGLSLPIVQRIIKLHGGRLWAESKVGEGATFYFSLPNQKET